MDDNHAFALTTNANQALSGTVAIGAVNATFLSQNIVAPRVPVFGPSAAIAGRYTAVARGGSGNALDVKIVIDSQNNIFLVTKNGSTVLGGFGTVSVQPNPSPSPSPSPGPSPSPSPSASPSPSPSPSASPSPSPSPSPSASPSPGSVTPQRHGDDGDEDDDEAEDHHEDDSRPTFSGTFSVNFVTGQLVTGNLRFSHNMLVGDFQLNGVTYTFRAGRQSSGNRLANIATRGFVNTGQGQLIGGFIITGGPKIVIIRALGPSLANAGVSPALADPTLQLFSGGTLLRENDNWQTAANANDVISSGVPPGNSLESAILIRLEPGAYTTVVRGMNNGTGIALVEIYEIDRD